MLFFSDCLRLPLRGETSPIVQFLLVRKPLVNSNVVKTEQNLKPERLNVVLDGSSSENLRSIEFRAADRVPEPKCERKSIPRSARSDSQPVRV